MTLSAATATSTLARVFAATRIGRPLGGRPDSDRTRKPWLALGMSERTFYRRRAASRVKAAPKPEQRAAHVDAWIATLSAIDLLDYRAWARRCRSACCRPPDWTPATAALVNAAVAARGS